MQKSLILALTLIAAGCGGSSHVELSLANDDMTAEQQGLTELSNQVDFTTLQSVSVTLTEVSVHVSGANDADEIHGDDIKDDDGKWVVISDQEQTFDLMAIEDNVLAPLGEADVPAGKITQIRMKLKTATPIENDETHLAAAVVNAEGQTCDMVVPASAVDPGVKISGVFKALPLESGTTHSVVISLRLSDITQTTDSTCSYRLNPVIKVRSFEKSSK
jgi:hypothetical protein